MANELTEWHPFSELAAWRNRIDQAFREMTNGGSADWTPAVDLVREEDRLVLRANVPGIKPEDVEVEVEGDRLTISGEHKEESERKERNYLRRERSYGSFYRSMGLPRGVKAEDIEASSRNGVLEVVIPLPKEETQRKTVSVKPKNES